MENVTRTMENALDKGQDLHNQYQGVKDKATATVRAASQKGNEAWSDTVEFVRKNPAQAVGISLAAGAALGVLAYALISRRSSSPYARFQKITEASQDGWDSVKEAMEKGLGSLKQALHDVQSSLK
jgi:ElaB/YqjD/DUF883 family membrane-anchored ribosome-binding protein